MRNHTCRALALGWAGATLLAACNDDGTGRLSLAVADAPVDDATGVVVQFDGIELKPRDGMAFSIDYAAPRRIDLLALQDGLSEPLLDDVVVPAGQYSWIRLKVGAQDGVPLSFIALEDGAMHPLRIPSGAQTGLKLVGGVSVPAGGAADFTVDFDLRKSVHAPEGLSPDYLLRPTLRLVDNAAVGAIAGGVDPLLIGVDCAPAVYVFAGDVAPDDVDGLGVEPVTTAIVRLDATDGEFRYRAALLPAGAYTVAFTCQADADDPAVNDDLVFAPVATATVTANATTTVDFSP